MFEASGKLLAGAGDPSLAAATASSNGHFDQCLADDIDQFRSQFCTVFFQTELVGRYELVDSQGHLKRPKLRVGRINGPPFPAGQAAFCLPSSCNARDLGSAVAQLIGRKVTSSSSIVTLVGDNYCHTRSKILSLRKDLDGLDVAFIVTSSLLGLLILAATLLDRKDRPLLSCFSAIGNIRRIFSSSDGQDLCCLNGVRVLSTTWIVLYHSYHYAVTMVPLGYNRRASAKVQADQLFAQK